MSSKSKPTEHLAQDKNDNVFREPTSLPPALKKGFNKESSPEVVNTNNGGIRKKRKFSSLPPDQEEPQPKNHIATSYVKPVTESGLDAAKARAQLINNKLKAEGKLSNETSLKPILPNTTGHLSLLQISQITKGDDNMYVAKVNINNLPMMMRSRLIQPEVFNSFKVTGSKVAVKGGYLPCTEKKLFDKIDNQLHLHIQSLTKEQVEEVIERVRCVVRGFNASGTEVMGDRSVGNIPGQPALPTGSYIQERIFVGMDDAPAAFDLKAKLVGPDYKNFTWISQLHGSKVILRGRGSGFLEPISRQEAFESMYIFISHPTQAGVDQSKKLVMNLIQKTRDDLSSYMNNYNPVTNYYNSYSGTYPDLAVANSNSTSGYNGLYKTTEQPPIQSGIPAPVPPPCISVEPYTKPYESSQKDPLNYRSTCNTLVSNTEAPVKTKPRRRFQEKGPDLTKVLGYRQYKSGVDSEEEKKLKKDSLKQKECPKPDTSNDDYLSRTQGSSGLPFWMSQG